MNFFHNQKEQIVPFFVGLLLMGRNWKMKKGLNARFGSPYPKGTMNFIIRFNVIVLGFSQ